jgi:hypothetical protein
MGKKTRLSAHLLWRGDFQRIAHPPKSARRQRDLYRQRMDLVVRRTSAASRAKALADRLGFQAAMSLSTLKGIQAWGALPFPAPLRPVVENHVSYLTFLFHSIKSLERAINRVATGTAETQWLCTVPGIANYLALLIASEVFDNVFADRQAGLSAKTPSSNSRVRGASRRMPGGRPGCGQAPKRSLRAICVRT